MRTSAFTIGLLLISSSAQAQWLHQSDDDAFENKAQHISMTVSGMYALGYVCQGDKSRFVYITPEKFSADLGITMMLLNPKLLVRVDDADVVKLDIFSEEADSKTKLVTDDEGSVDLAKAVAVAKKRVAVAVEVGGQLFHKTNFGVAGSKDALNKALDGCKASKSK